jgi:homocysteine S-methyltransferase
VAASTDAVFAVGVNCCAPEDVLDAIRVATEVTDKLVVVYPNSGERWDGVLRSWSGSSGFDPALAVSWVDAGASYVGGCCRVGPREIEAVAQAVH